MNKLIDGLFGIGSVQRRLRLLALAACVIVAMGSVALLPDPALAQASPAAGAYTVVQDRTKMVTPLSLTVDQVDGMVIMYSTQQIGTVNEVLADASGNIVAVVATYGGFFGFFEKNAVVPLDALNKGQGYLNSNTNQFDALPAWQ